MSDDKLRSFLSLINKFFIFRKNSYSSFMLDSKFHILSTLYHGPDTGMAVSDLADKLSVSCPAVSRSIGSMADEGLVERSTDPDDKRSTYIKISPKGLKAYIATKDQVHLLIEEVLDKYDQEDLDSFLKMGQNIADDLLELSNNFAKKQY